MPTPSNPQQRPWQPRFSIAGMMLVTLLFGVAMAGVSYLVRYGGNVAKIGNIGTMIFLLITLAGPLIVVIFVSLGRAVMDWLSRKK